MWQFRLLSADCHLVSWLFCLTAGEVVCLFFGWWRGTNFAEEMEIGAIYVDFFVV